MTSLKVAVRVRPLNQRELNMDSQFIIDMDGKKTTITNPKVSEQGTEGDKGREAMRTKVFSFDFSFWTVDPGQPKFASQEQVFQSLGLDVVSAAYEGFNACVFAYGQTSSGKTYTMMGNPDDPGLIPRICQELFSKMTEQNTSYRTQVSYLEIYNEHVRDLLRSSSSHRPVHNLRVREHPKEGPYVQDLSKHNVHSFNDIKEWMVKGNSVRTTASTNMNDTSSRSHAIFTIVFTQANFSSYLPREMCSKIHLVDLAGSERADASGATGQRLKEGGSINKSLVTLGSVISVLADMSDHKPRTGKTFIPYRDSVLTWLLKDSLGGNSKTIMIATLSPADVNYAETMSTLRYANRAKNIINRPTVNEDGNVKLIRELRAEIDRLKTLLGGDIDLITSPKVQEKLHQSEARAKVLTNEWMGKWSEAANILQEKTLDLRKEGVGVVLDSALPHLIGIDDNILSTGIMLYHLKEGTTTVGRADAEEKPDIVIAGLEVEQEHCVIACVDGETKIYPADDALCTVNGTCITEPTKLTQGAVILLGRTNMFRFNNPAEAAKMKKELKNSGLNLSCTSLLSRSMTDLYKSSENLSLMGAGWEVENMHREELENLEEKRRQIELLELEFQQSEDDRQQQQLALESELKEKQNHLETIQKELQTLTKEAEKERKIKQKQTEELKSLVDKEQKTLEAARRSKQDLLEEVEKLKIESDQLRSHLNKELESMEQLQKDLKVQLTVLEQNLCNKREPLEFEKQTENERSIRENEILEKLHNDLETLHKRNREDNSELKEQWQNVEHHEQEVKEKLDRLGQERKVKWESMVENVAIENQRIEEAWRDLQEHEQRNKLALDNGEFEDDEDRKKLEQEREKLENARKLLKAEEDALAVHEREILDQVEIEMDEWEKTKKKQLEEIEAQKINLRDKYKNSEMEKLEEEYEHQKSLVEGHRLTMAKRKQEMSDLEQKFQMRNSEVLDQEKNLCLDKERLLSDFKSQEQNTQKAVSDINLKLQEIDKNCDEDIQTMQTNKERLLRLLGEGLDTDLTEDTPYQTPVEREGEAVGVSKTDVEYLEKRRQELQELQQELEQRQLELEDKQRSVEEEHYSELDRIEFERLKLQEMEHQERINALVEQEVKRQMFEEKNKREKHRRMERERERKERQMEIQKLKIAHNREIKQLKERYEKEKITPNKILSPSTANPYVTAMPSDTGQATDTPSRRSGSSDGNRSQMTRSQEPLPILTSITIPSYRLQCYGADAHYEYEVKVVFTDEHWSIFRRYSRFRQLHQELRRSIQDVGTLVFPPKKLFSKSEKVAAERRKQLEFYLHNLIEILKRNPDCALHPSRNSYLTKPVLCDFAPFFRRGLFEASKHGTS